MPLTPNLTGHKLAASHTNSGQHSRYLSAFFMSGFQGSQPLINGIKTFKEEQTRILPVTVRVSGRVVTGEYNTRKGNSQSRLFAVRDTRPPQLNEVFTLKQTGKPTMKPVLIQYHLTPLNTPSNKLAITATLTGVDVDIIKRIALLRGFVIIDQTTISSHSNTIKAQVVRVAL